jgi:hypothetical protein
MRIIFQINGAHGAPYKAFRFNEQPWFMPLSHFRRRAGTLSRRFGKRAIVGKVLPTYDSLRVLRG